MGNRPDSVILVVIWLPTEMKIRFGTKSIFIYVTVAALCLVWWLDSPRRTVERLHAAIAAKDFHTANTFFSDRANRFSDWNSGRTHFLTGLDDIGLSSRNAVFYEDGWWDNAKTQWHSPSMDDILHGRRYFTFVGDNQEEYTRLLFQVEGGECRVFETNQPYYSETLMTYTNPTAR